MHHGQVRETGTHAELLAQGAFTPLHACRRAPQRLRRPMHRPSPAEAAGQPDGAARRPRRGLAARALRRPPSSSPPPCSRRALRRMSCAPATKSEDSLGDASRSTTYCGGATSTPRPGEAATERSMPARLRATRSGSASATVTRPWHASTRIKRARTSRPHRASRCAPHVVCFDRRARPLQGVLRRRRGAPPRRPSSNDATSTPTSGLGRLSTHRLVRRTPCCRTSWPIDRVQLAVVIITNSCTTRSYLGRPRRLGDEFVSRRSSAIAGRPSHCFTARGDTAPSPTAARAWQDALTFSAFLGRFHHDPARRVNDHGIAPD